MVILAYQTVLHMTQLMDQSVEQTAPSHKLEIWIW